MRRRGARNYEARSPPRPSSQATGSAHQTPESRTSSLADEFVDQVRRSMLGTPRSEPGQEPGDFISGAVVFEGYTHPETWDPEVDGEIYPGKGEPPPWFFEEKGKKGGKKGEGKAKGKARAGEGGAGGSREDPVSRPDFQIPPFPNLGRRDDGEPSRRGDQGSRGAEGGGEQTQVNPPERVEGMPAVYLTPYGAKYHTSYNCRSLREGTSGDQIGARCVRGWHPMTCQHGSTAKGLKEMCTSTCCA